MCSQSGQATVEWVGLLLMVALALGALTALRAPSGERGLGELLAKRIAAPAAAPPPRRVSPPAPGRVSPRAPRRVLPPAPISRARVADAFQRLRGVGFQRLRGFADVTKRVWIACLGYRRFLYELERPRMPGEAMSAEEALEVADACVNPYNFLHRD